MIIILFLKTFSYCFIQQLEQIIIIYQTKFGHNNYVFKLKSDINDILFETFIYHVDFIAIHLRTGKISRGELDGQIEKHDLREEIKDLVYHKT